MDNLEQNEIGLEEGKKLDLEREHFNASLPIIGIYVSGFLLLHVRFIWQLFRLRKKSTIKRLGNVSIVITDKNGTIFSFGRSIYFSKQQFHDKSRRLLFLHEYAHIKQVHSIDRDIVEIASIVLWFSPFIWLFRRSIIEVHEYICDKIVIQKGHSAKEYLQCLYQQCQSKITHSMASGFYQSTIKKRLKMIKNNNNQVYLKWAYLAMLPISTFSLMAFSLGETSNNWNVPLKMIESVNDILQVTSKLSTPSGLPMKENSFYRIASGYGMRMHPILKEKRMHNGIDFSAKIGTPIYATTSGKVIKAESEGGLGIHISIQHTSNYKSTYSHLSKTLVKEGEEVKKGQIIGECGNTGLSVDPHLHYRGDQKWKTCGSC